MIIVDLKKPTGPGSTPHTSAYVQLSRATALNRLSILRPFQAEDLHQSIPMELMEELNWQENMAELTTQKYQFINN